MMPAPDLHSATEGLTAPYCPRPGPGCRRAPGRLGAAASAVAPILGSRYDTLCLPW